jgi:hypothetical protein
VLSEFETRLVARVAELVAARAGLSVAQAGGAPPALPSGEGRVLIGVADVAPDSTRGFAPGDRRPEAEFPPAVRIRVVPVRATVTLAFRRRGASASDADLRAARRTLLEDVTLVLHGLDAETTRTGANLGGAGPDPGFAVGEFVLSDVTVSAAPTGDEQTATASYLARLLVWPPGETAEVGIVSAVDALLEAQPLQITVDPPVLAAGGTATVRIRGVAGSRLSDVDTGVREPVRLAVGIRSDLPPADRGTVTGGTAGAVAGFRIVPVTGAETVVSYAAPAGPLGTVRGEEVVVHLAVIGDQVGVRLGSVSVGLRAGP